ncbi:MAG: 2-dehydropantoate 2-reductase [Chloroflexia bacterium]|nr:2-dehydropantoate 2-reductase [Chloroflexia bacterium]
MKFAIVGGAGAMGGVWASRLNAGGEEVAILDVAPEALGAINRDGLIVERKDGSTDVARVVATDQAEAIGATDAVIFFTKSYHTAEAAALARPLVDAKTTVVSLQNGWGNSDTLASIFPPEQIVMGVTYHSAMVRGPGRIAYTNDAGPTVIGPYADGARLDRAEAVGAAMTRAGLEMTITPAVKTEIWKKLILNCATLPTSALTRLYAGELGKPGPLLDFLDVITGEATAVANGLGYEIDLTERIETIHGLLGRGGKGKASMLQDVEGQRKTEIDVINGAVVREADRLGIEVPVNRGLVALVGGLERSWQQ